MKLSVPFFPLALVAAFGPLGCSSSPDSTEQGAQGATAEEAYSFLPGHCIVSTVAGREEQTGECATLDPLAPVCRKAASKYCVAGKPGYGITYNFECRALVDSTRCD